VFASSVDRHWHVINLNVNLITVEGSLNTNVILKCHDVIKK
jgi:hypothetical protein